jgi:hypothetical protein
LNESGADHTDHCESNDESRQRQENIDKPHDKLIDPATMKPSEESNTDADNGYCSSDSKR